jgi:two-component system phosphate regulon sensor histidine kinase PhoR
MNILWLLLFALVLGWFLHARGLSRHIREKDKRIAYLEDESKRLNASLVVRTHRLDDLLSAIEEAVLRVDRLGRVMSANAKGLNLFGIKNASALPQSMVLFYRDPDWLTAFTQAVQALPDVVELPEIFIGEKVFLPRLAGLGEGQGLLLCLDVTEQYRLQEQRKTFVSDLMHDLKTPLTSLLGYARSLESFADDEALRKEAVQVIAQEAKHVNGLLDGLLSVEQIEYGGAGNSQCDMVSLCEQTWKILQPEMDVKGLQLDLQLPDTFNVVMQDSDCLRVLMNIASNAVRYSNDNGKIYCFWRDGCLYIEDEGVGIPEKDLPHVTERFYRVDDARLRGGHGLGLAIVQEILQRDGGSLVLANRKPNGLSVRVMLPAV